MWERRLIWRVAPTAPLPTRTECVVARRDRTLAAWHPSGVVDPVNTRTCQTVTNTLPTLFRTACPASPRVHPLSWPRLSEDTARQVSARLLGTDFDASSEALARRSGS